MGFPFRHDHAALPPLEVVTPSPGVNPHGLAPP